MHFGQAGNSAQHYIFDARLRGGGYRNRIAITSKTGSHPDNMDFFDCRSTLGFASIGNYFGGCSIGGYRFCHDRRSLLSRSGTEPGK